MSILIAHPGTQHIHHLVRGMVNAGQPVEYHTSLVFGEEYFWRAFWPKGLYRKRRVFGIPDACIYRQPWLESLPALLQKLGRTNTDAYARRNQVFQQRIPAQSLQRASAIIGFDTSSVFLEQRARTFDVPFFLELTTPHSKEKQEWVEFIRNSFPQWPTDSFRKSNELVQREDEEVNLATVVSVPSAFVRDSHLRRSNSTATFVINPYGIDLTGFYPKQTYSNRARFCYVGGGNAAKGAPILIEAWRRANPDADLVIAGHGSLPAGVSLPPNVSWEGPIAKSDRLDFYHKFDVLICPSLYEGLAIVQLEAAACGLTVLGTSNSGGAELLTHGQNSWFVPAGNVDALADAITVLTNDGALRHGLGRAAAVQARVFSWDAYVVRWLQLLKKYDAL